MASRNATVKFSYQRLVFFMIALAALYVVVPQLGSFRHSLRLVTQADWAYILLAVVFVCLTYLAAAGTYYWLALRALSYAHTAWIQTAGAFVNRLLPAGIGGIGINYAYLRKAGHTVAEAASVVAVNNLLGFIGHFLLLVILLGLYHEQLPPLRLVHIHNFGLVITLAALALIVLIWLYRQFHVHILKGLRAFLMELTRYKRRPGHIIAALMCSMSLTLCNVAGLWLSAQAVGFHLSFIIVFLVFSFGIALGTATPTPGGLGGVETGLVVGLTVYHMSAAEALAAVLIYRLLSYWLPLGLGILSFIYIRQRRFI